jgi:hypothetical protein
MTMHSAMALCITYNCIHCKPCGASGTNVFKAHVGGRRLGKRKHRLGRSPSEHRIPAGSHQAIQAGRCNADGEFPGLAENLDRRNGLTGVA